MNKHIIAKKPTYFYAPLLYLSSSSDYIRINSKLRDEIGFERYMGEHKKRLLGTEKPVVLRRSKKRLPKVSGINR
jgi:hypothetical protein